MLPVGSGGAADGLLGSFPVTHQEDDHRACHGQGGAGAVHGRCLGLVLPVSSGRCLPPAPRQAQLPGSELFPMESWLSEAVPADPWSRLLAQAQTQAQAQPGAMPTASLRTGPQKPDSWEVTYLGLAPRDMGKGAGSRMGMAKQQAKGSFQAKSQLLSGPRRNCAVHRSQFYGVFLLMKKRIQTYRGVLW